MYLVNYHVHSICSPDADYPMTEMVAAAEKAGVDELCFTDHCDVVDCHGKIIEDFDFEPLRQQFYSIKSPVRLKFGIELGQAVRNIHLADKIISNPELDFIIGSNHNAPGDVDFYFKKYSDKKVCLDMMEAYLLEELKLADTDYYDVLGHLTYPQRYMNARDGVDVDFSPFADLIKEIFLKVVQNGRGIELNTSGYRNNKGEPMPPERFLRLYKQCGGEIITIGSDAHFPEHIASGLDKGLALLSKCGFEYITVFSKRKPEFIKIEG